MKRLATLISTFLIVFVVGAGLGYGLVNPSQYERRIGDLEKEITDLDSQVSTLQTEKAGLESQLVRLERQIGVLGVYFSPRGGCEDQVLNWISRANVSIHVLIYSFTLDSIGDALLAARNRGVGVQIVFEVEQISKYSEYQKLREAGVAVRNDTNSKLMHDKVMIVDGTIVLTGSFNWSTSAEESNNENLIVISSAHIAGIHEEEFQRIWNDSV